MLLKLKDCPHFTQLIDFTKDDNDLYILMKRVEGVTLNEIIEKALQKKDSDPDEFYSLMLKLFV